MEYMIGQQVIYGDVIYVVCKPEDGSRDHWIWVDNPERGYKHAVNSNDIKPLSNNQL